MYINITDNKEASNKGSSSGLVNYLEKENRTEDLKQPELWFNGSRQDVEAYEVRRALDGNNAKLGRHEAKFFLINISPSQKELEHLRKSVGDPHVKNVLKVYTEKVMDEYAKNFRRSGINSNKDLLWFGKVEHNRYYSHKDAAVKDGSRKRGEKKNGNQLHVQVIVSRRDISNKIKLSPMNSSKGKNAEHSKKMGQFDRMAFKQCGERLFDEQFGFERNLKDTLAHANILKNGTLQQREQLDVLLEGAAKSYQSRLVANDLARDVAKGLFSSVGDMLQVTGKLVGEFLEVLIAPVYVPDIAADTVEEAEKRRRKKSRKQGRGMQR
ncbi:DUF5712 family protein [Pedobacter psychrodurus]|uniref:DUF5712 family protein n=1 Tax=Pedobacter psychrodurus TaxID=2530456 RepID=UPI002931B8AA|nr:DUF5712 family protein [Pedobacter psychrodurus]